MLSDFRREGLNQTLYPFGFQKRGLNQTLNPFEFQGGFKRNQKFSRVLEGSLTKPETLSGLKAGV